MARSAIGSLIVTLGLNAAEFTTGLTKSEAEAKRFAKSIDDGIKTAASAATIAIAGLAAASLVAFKAIDSLAKQAGEFKDLEEKTGANAEALASFAVAAGTAGIAMSEVAALSIKLTKNLTGVDDESKDAGAAIAALGLNLAEFKKLDPATQLETIAKALVGFEDGASKTAVAIALLGKSGADALPFLKELGAEGGRQVILTQQQIERADAYADAQAKASAQLHLYAQAAATEMLPALTALTSVTKDFIKELLGVATASNGLPTKEIQSFAENVAIGFAKIIDVGDGVIRVFQGVGLAAGAGLAARGEAMKGNFSGAREIIRLLHEDLDKLAQKEQLSVKLEKQFADQRKTSSLAALEDRGFKPPGKVLTFAGASAKEKTGAEKASDVDRLIESLEKQLQGTLELNEAQKAEVAIYDLLAKGEQGLSESKKATIRDIATQLDLDKQAKEAAKEKLKAIEEANKSEQALSQATFRWAQEEQKAAATIRQGNDQLREQIVFLKGGQDALDARTIAKNADAIATLKQKEAALIGLEASDLVVAGIRAQIAALEDRNRLIGDLKFEEQLKAEAANLQQFKDLFTDTFANAFSSIVDGSKSAKEAFKDFEKSILQSLSRIASQNLAESLFGGKSSGGRFDLGKLFGSIGAGGGGGGFDFGQFLSLFGQKLGFSANGTSFAAGGPMMVGERGPEVVNLPRGSQVIPNHSLPKGGGNISITVNQTVMPGANTQTARQAAAQAGRSVRGALARG